MILGCEATLVHITDANVALCGQTELEIPAAITRDSLFCGECWDTWADRIPDVSSSTYHDYLLSTIWARTRQLAFEFYGRRCCLCNSEDDLNVHHRTYERLGRERLADLVVLCRECHATFHGKAA